MKGRNNEHETNKIKKRKSYNTYSTRSYNNSASNPCGSKHNDANRTKPEY